MRWVVPPSARYAAVVTAPADDSENTAELAHALPAEGKLATEVPLARRSIAMWPAAVGATAATMAATACAAAGTPHRPATGNVTGCAWARGLPLRVSTMRQGNGSGL